MAKNVVMPALEMAQETGTIVSWIKKEGDVVAKGEAILEIETDKATVEVESLADGILAGVTAVEGDVIPVGQTIAWIVAPGEETPSESEQMVSGRATSQKSDSRNPTGTAWKGVPSAPKASGGAKVSPKARRLAKEHSVDLSTIVGTGPDGAITGDDVLAARDSSPVDRAPSSVPTPPVPSAVARLMAERTTQSWTQAPHFFLTRPARRYN